MHDFNVLGRSILFAALSAAVPALLAGPLRAQEGIADRVIAGQTVILNRYDPPPQVGTVELGVEDARSKVDMGAAEAVRFRLRGVSVEGARSVPPGSLAPLWQGRIGQVVTLAEMYRIAEAVDAAYLRAGYFSKTVVPVQDYASGTIRLQVFESYVDRIEINSDISGIDRRLAPWLDRILAMHPIRVAEAERVLLLMSDLGGLEIEGVFVRPDGATGGGLLRLQIDQDRTAGMIGLDNLGSEAVGPLQLAGILDLDDHMGLFESSNLTGVVTPGDPRQLGLLQFSQDYPIGSDGLSAGFGVTFLRQRPGGSLADQEIDVTSATATAHLSYPFLRRLDHSLFGRAELTLRNDDVDVGDMAVSRSETRWVSLTLDYDRALEKGGFSADGGVSFGVASDLDMGDVPDDFRYVSGGLQYSRMLGEELLLRVIASAQYSARELPGAVQFAVGGDPYGWAFDNGSLSGDSGAAMAVALSHDVETGWDPLPVVTPSAFVDFGSVWYREPGDGPVSESLGSYGIGVSGMLSQTMQFQVVAAIPWRYSAGVEDPGKQLLFRLAFPL